MRVDARVLILKSMILLEASFKTKSHFHHHPIG